MKKMERSLVISLIFLLFSSHLWCMDLREGKGHERILQNFHNGEEDNEGVAELSPLIAAIREHKMEVLQTLFKASQENFKGIDFIKKGWCLLHESAMYGDREITEFLLEQGYEVDLEGEERVTPLELATLEGHEEIVKLLLDRGADIGHQNEYGTTVFHIAASEGYENLLRLFLTHHAFRPELLDLQTRDTKKTCIHRALENKHLKIAELLVSYGANIEIGDNEQQTIMHYAADIAQTNLIKNILTMFNGPMHLPLFASEHDEKKHEILDLVNAFNLERQRHIYKNSSDEFKKLLLKANLVRKIKLTKNLLRKYNCWTQTPADKAKFNHYKETRELLDPNLVERNFKKTFKNQLKHLLDAGPLV